ncbi:MAG TPA: serine O-acetyltransferase EpsC [Polyangiales bacterium]
MTRPKTWLVSDIWSDLTLILAYWKRPPTLRNVLWALFACDGFVLLSMFRTRQWLRRHHIPVAGRLIRMLETMFFAVEIAVDAELGRGVLFMHTVGTVVGSGSSIGDGCILLGNNTFGSNEQGGAPSIGAHTIIGAGVRVLGAVRVGERCALGANAVVLSDIPDGKIAVGIPARVIKDNPAASNTAVVER